MNRTYLKTSIRIFALTVVVGVLAAGWVRADSVGATFATGSGQGGIELKIDAKTYYNNVLQPKLSWALKNLEPWCDFFFDFDDVKPGDTGTTTISIHIKQNPAFVCLDFKNYKEKENGINEPESLLDNDNDGELGEELEFFAWRDDGDNKFEVGEKALFGTSSQSAVQTLKNTSYPLADATTGNPYQPNQTKYIGITWCAGNLSVDVATAKVSCDATAMDNEAQTDSLTLDVSFRAVPSKQNPNFTCNKHTLPPPPPVKCEIEGHKYDQNGQPLQGWTIGLMKVITHNRGTDVYDLATAVTDKKGYYCLRWDGEKRTPRGVVTYVNGPYNFTYRVFEKMQSGWILQSIEKGPHYSDLSVVPANQIFYDGKYRSVQIGVQNGYIYTGAEYHVDFYNLPEGSGWREKPKNTVTEVAGRIRDVVTRR